MRRIAEARALVRPPLASSPCLYFHAFLEIIGRPQDSLYLGATYKKSRGTLADLPIDCFEEIAGYA